MILEKFILQDEDDGALELRPYWDTEGYLTIGPGLNLGVRCVDPEIRKKIELPKYDIFTEEQILFLYRGKLAAAESEFGKRYPQFSCRPGISLRRYHVLVGMFYQLGLSRFRKFVDMLGALEKAIISNAQDDWNAVAEQILDSQAARKLPKRYGRYAAMMREG